MRKKILLSLLTICIVSLTGCSKNDAGWEQKNEQLGDIKIEEDVEPSGEASEISPPEAEETTLETENTESSMTFDEIINIPESEGDLTNEDFKNMVAIDNKSNELEILNYYCYKATSTTASGTTGEPGFTNVETKDKVHVILEFKNKENINSKACEIKIKAYDKNNNLLDEKESYIAQILPGNIICDSFEISCDYAYDISKITTEIIPSESDILNTFDESPINNNILSSEFINTVEIVPSENYYNIKVSTKDFGEYYNYYGSLYHTLLIFNKNGELVARDCNYDSLINQNEETTEPLYISEKYFKALEGNDDEFTYKLWTYIEIEQENIIE